MSHAWEILLNFLKPQDWRDAGNGRCPGDFHTRDSCWFMLIHGAWCMVHGMRILMDIYWLVVYLPLWKIWFSQLGWWYSQYMESHKNHVPNHLSQREITGFVQIPGAGKSSNLLEDWKKPSHVWWPECNASNIKLLSSIGLVLQQVA
jgi:hypothetical protein